MDVYGFMFFFLAAVVIYVFIVVPNRKERYLIKNGVSVTAKLISINKTMVMIGQGSFAKPQMELVLDIESLEMPYKKVTIRHVFGNNEVQPKPNDKIHILIDPANPANVMLSPNQGP
jgi:hypothetical protein